MKKVVSKLTLQHKLNKTTTTGISVWGKSRNSKTMEKKYFSPKKTRNGR